MKKKRKKRRQRHYDTAVNYHHILFQGKHWQTGYAKLLRDHPYMGKMVRAESLHALIHSKIHDVPRPDNKHCKRAYLELQRREVAGEIDVEKDTLEQRIDFLVEMWRETCPATTAILLWQRQVVAKYFARCDQKRARRRQRELERQNLVMGGGN